MATKVEAAHQMMVMAARRKDSGRRNDLEAGMAKYLASEYGKEVVEDAFRIHGGYGFSKEYDIVAQARAAWEAAVCWDPSGTDQFAVKRLAEVRAV